MLTERTFLRMQSAAAKARLRQQAKALTDELLAPLRVRPLVRRHPWLSLGGALLTGFLAVGGLARGPVPDAVPTPSRPREPVRALLRQVRRIAASALGAGLLSSWRAGSPPTPPAPPENGDVTGAS